MGDLLFSLYFCLGSNWAEMFGHPHGTIWPSFHGHTVPCGWCNIPAQSFRLQCSLFFTLLQNEWITKQSAAERYKCVRQLRHSIYALPRNTYIFEDSLIIVKEHRDHHADQKQSTKERETNERGDQGHSSDAKKGNNNNVMWDWASKRKEIN
jgi:hypothetical protein